MEGTGNIGRRDDHGEARLALRSGCYLCLEELLREPEGEPLLFDLPGVICFFKFFRFHCLVETPLMNQSFQYGYMRNVKICLASLHGLQRIYSLEPEYKMKVFCVPRGRGAH